MIRIVEVGPRDGLQNEQKTIPTDVKVAYIDALSVSGVSEIEASAFVSPKWIPQLSDASDVFKRIVRNPKVVYSALVPNMQGLDRAVEAKVDKVAVFTAASETFNRKNINASIAESIDRFVPVLQRSKQLKLPVRGYVSTCFWCPYEGKIEPQKAVDVVLKLIDLGVDEVSIGDTIGKADANEVRDFVQLLAPRVPVAKVAMHFHDTYKHAHENALLSWRFGITTFDSSAGGIGGCPYAPGASGNVATESLVWTLREAGAPVGVNLDAISKARAIIAPAVGRI